MNITNFACATTSDGDWNDKGFYWKHKSGVEIIIHGKSPYYPLRTSTKSKYARFRVVRPVNSDGIRASLRTPRGSIREFRTLEDAKKAALLLL